MGATPVLATKCASCATDLAPTMLSCPFCHALVHGARLTSLAAEAARQTEAGAFVEAKGTWTDALALLPSASQQHAAIQARIAQLDARIAAAAAAPAGPKANPAHPAWRRWATSAGAMVLVLLGKLKFLLLGLSKASTLFSMLAFFGVYWTQFGWPLALGMVLSIYVHEMGHVAALHRAGIPASAPFFIPGLGALVRLRQHIGDEHVNATIGLAGPVWGLGAALAAWAAWLATGVPVWGAIAHLGAYINLFNLIPVWQLDGARGMDALNRWQRGVLVAVIAITFAMTHEKLLVIIGAVALYQTVRAPERTGNPRILALFAALVVALGWMATMRV